MPTFPPIPGGQMRTAPDEYTGPLVQEIESLAAVCAACGTRYVITAGSPPHHCVGTNGVDVTERQFARQLVKSMLAAIDDVITSEGDDHLIALSRLEGVAALTRPMVESWFGQPLAGH